ncbi:MAG: CheR family methyltransferase, partial [Nitrospirota bacterium]
MTRSPHRPLKLTEEEFHLFQQFLVRECGLHFPRDRDDAVAAGIGHRMVKTGKAAPQEYFQFLQDDLHGPNERKALFELLTIGETSFFRNPAQFSALCEVVVPDLVRRAGSDRRIRIWSAGASTGEEPYT